MSYCAVSQDKYILGSMVLMHVVSVWHAIITRIESNPELAKTMDEWAFVILVLVFGFYNVAFAVIMVIKVCVCVCVSVCDTQNLINNHSFPLFWLLFHGCTLNILRKHTSRCLKWSFGFQTKEKNSFISIPIFRELVILEADMLWTWTKFALLDAAPVPASW